MLQYCRLVALLCLHTGVAFAVLSELQIANAQAPNRGQEEKEVGEAESIGQKELKQDKSTDTNRKDETSRKIQIGEGTPTQVEVGRIAFPTYEFDPGKKRLFYGLYLPQGFERSKTYPLIVVLHGLNGSPGQILAYPGLTKHADDEGYILVAPMGYNARGWYGSRGKGGGRRGDPPNLGELSEKDVMNVLELTQEEFQIDPNRIYLFGHSMGGGGSMHLAMTYPDLWAAMAVVAPAAYGDTDRLQTAKDIPAYVVQGDKDRLVSVRQTRRWVEKMEQIGMKHEYIEVKNGGHVFLAWQHFDGIFTFFADNPKQNKVDPRNATEETPTTL